MNIKFLQSPDAERERVGSHVPSTTPQANSASTTEFMATVSTGEFSYIVAAHLTERDYRLARLTMPEICAFNDYGDWLDFRAGTFWGLEMAGFSVELVAVDLAEFAHLLRTTSIPPSISALDRFACFRHLRVVGGQHKQNVFQAPTGPFRVAKM